MPTGVLLFSNACQQESWSEGISQMKQESEKLYEFNEQILYGKFKRVCAICAAVGLRQNYINWEY